MIIFKLEFKIYYVDGFSRNVSICFNIHAFVHIEQNIDVIEMAY
jgi:hypothetical protein